MTVGADAFVTAELKYNQFMDAGDQLLLVDAGHYETEQFTKELLAGIIQKKMINFAVLISQVNTNPVQYY
jgi:putative NIF3 family GTP cyclohydrolase 1 type 2